MPRSISLSFFHDLFLKMGLFFFNFVFWTVNSKHMLRIKVWQRLDSNRGL